MTKGVTSTKECDKCHNEFSLFAFNRHYKSCNGNYTKAVIKYDVPDNLICPFCNKIGKTKLSWIKHYQVCLLNPNRLIPFNTGKKGSNQFIKCKKLGLPIPKLSNESLQKIKDTKIKNGTNIHTEETKIKLSKSMRQAVLDHPESYCSSNIKTRYKKCTKYNINFDSEWELIFYEYCLVNNIKISRPNISFDYNASDGIRQYFPDFYLNDFNIWIEIKGYENDKDRNKWRDFPEKLIIIREKEIKEIKLDKFNLMIYKE